MKKTFKILGIILLIIILLIAGLAIWQRDKIKLLYVAYKYTPDEIQLQIDDHNEKLQKNIEMYTGIVFRPMTEEEQEQINSGKMTRAEVFDKILNETLEEYLNRTSSGSKTSGAGSGNSDTAAKPNNTYDDINAKYISQIYSIKNQYMGMLEELIGQAKAEFSALPASQRTTGARSSIISKYISVAGGYESSCDGEVNAVLSSFESELKKAGADTSVISAIRDSYYEEKNAKIAYYMSQLK